MNFFLGITWVEKVPPSCKKVNFFIYTSARRSLNLSGNSKVSFGQLSKGWWVWPVHEYPSLGWEKVEKHQLRGKFLEEGLSQRYDGKTSADSGLGIACGGFLRGSGVTRQDGILNFSFLTETTSSSGVSFRKFGLIMPLWEWRSPSRIILYKIQAHLIIILKIFLILLLPLSPCHKTRGTAVDQYFHVIFHLSP